MTISAIRLERFTAFQKNMIDFSPGLNVLIGANGTGKTHLMKVAYAVCDISKTKTDFADKLVRVFLPSERAIGRLVKRQKKNTRCAVEVFRDNIKLRASFSNHATHRESITVTGATEWGQSPIESVYIPVKEMLSNAPGFRSLYTQREVHFEEVYADILDRAYRPALRGQPDATKRKLMRLLQKTIDGKVLIKDEEFFLRIHSLFPSPETEGIACHTTSDYNGIHPNAIADAFSSVYDREIKRSLAGLQV